MAKKYPNVRERNGKFHYRYSIKDRVTGNRVQKETKGFATAKEAYQAGIAIESELIKGTYVEEDNMKFVDWCDRWLTLYETSGKVKARSVAIRRQSLIRARKEFAGLKLKEVTKLQYEELLSTMKLEGLSERTVTMLHEAMRLLYKKAKAMELIKIDITENAELPSFKKTVLQLEKEAESPLPRYLEKEEVALLLQAADEYGEEQYLRSITVLIYTGMRVGELCALKITDIDEINKQISITKTLDESNGLSNFKIGTPKTSASARKIDVSEKIIGVIKSQLAWRREYKMSTRKQFYSKEDYLFINTNSMPGKPLSIRRLQEYLKHVLRLACLPVSITPHSLRHTYASLMAEAGEDLAAIQQQLGHRSDEVTKAIYLHVTKARRRTSVEKLDNLLDSVL